MKLPDDSHTAAVDDIFTAVATKLESKWCHCLEASSQYDELMRRVGGHRLQFDPGDVTLACCRIRRPQQPDRFGLCGIPLRVITNASPGAVEAVVCEFLSHPGAFESMQVHTRAAAKRKVAITVDEVRTKLPLSNLLQVADIILSVKLHAIITDVVPMSDGCLCAAAKGH